MNSTSAFPNWAPRLRRAEASRYLCERHGIIVAPSTLAKWFSQKSDGPPARLFGRFPLYEPASLDTWAIRRLGTLRLSTSDPGTGGEAEPSHRSCCPGSPAGDQP
jgi:hypothetical protein